MSWHLGLCWVCRFWFGVTVGRLQTCHGPEPSLDQTDPLPSVSAGCSFPDGFTRLCCCHVSQEQQESPHGGWMPPRLPFVLLKRSEDLCEPSCLCAGTPLPFQLQPDSCSCGKTEEKQARVHQKPGDKQDEDGLQWQSWFLSGLKRISAEKLASPFGVKRWCQLAGEHLPHLWQRSVLVFEWLRFLLALHSLSWILNPDSDPESSCINTS